LHLKFHFYVPYCVFDTAAELERWLAICDDQQAFAAPGSSSSRRASSAVPDNLSKLQPWQVESLRQLVVLMECERLAATTAVAGSAAAAQDSLMLRLRRGAAGTDAWLQDYTHTPQVYCAAQQWLDTDCAGVLLVYTVSLACLLNWFLFMCIHRTHSLLDQVL
jgi:hypothetical protein